MKLTTITLLAIAMAGTSSASIILNGNFEGGMTGGDPNFVDTELGRHKFGPGSFGTTLPTGWTRTGSRIWSITDQSAVNAFPSSLGDYAVRLDANSAGGEDRLIQSGLQLTAGTEYTFSVDLFSTLSTGPMAGTGADISVELTGADNIAVLTNYTDSTVGVETVTTRFTATVTGTYNLEIYDAMQLSASSNNHAIIDNVSLTAVPEPSSAALCALGALSLCLRRARKSK